MTTPRSIADRVEALLKINERSLAWLSRTTGIAYKTLERHMADPERFILRELAAIARAFGVPLESILTDKEVSEVAA